MFTEVSCMWRSLPARTDLQQLARMLSQIVTKSSFCSCHVCNGWSGSAGGTTLRRVIERGSGPCYVSAFCRT